MRGFCFLCIFSYPENLILRFHSEINIIFVLGFLHGRRDEFTDDVSETVVGPIFIGHD
jgi:hypothetical protein